MASLIPAIPGLHNVQDKAAQEALRALTQGWELRNGQNPDYRFLTKSDVVALAKTLIPAQKADVNITKNITEGTTPTPESTSTPTPGANNAGLLDSGNIWTKPNTFDQPTPATELSQNEHIILSQDGAQKWVIRLGHRPIPVAPGGSNGNNTLGDMVLTAHEAVFLRLQSFANGGAISFLDRSATNSQFKAAMRLANFMHISWNSENNVKTWFDPNNSRWGITYNDIERFSVNANTYDPFAIAINGLPMTGANIKHIRASDEVSDVYATLRWLEVRLNAIGA